MQVLALFLTIFPLVFCAILTLVVGKVLLALGGGGRRRGFLAADKWAVRPGDEVFDDAPPGGMGHARRTATREDSRRPVAVRFTPPDGLAPEDCGALRTGEPVGTDIAAAVVALVVGGYQQISRGPERSTRFGAPARTWRLRGLRREPVDRLTPAQAALLDGLPAPGQESTLDDLRQTMRPAAAAARRALCEPSRLRAWWTPSSRGTVVRVALAGTGLLLLALTLPKALRALDSLASTAGDESVRLALAAAACGVLFASTTFVPSTRRRTALGSAQVYALQGFREYLRTAEGRSLRLDEAAAEFSRNLPWAVALGVTSEWTRAFQEAVTLADAATAASWGDALAWNGDLDLGGTGVVGEGLGDAGSSVTDLGPDLGFSLGDLGTELGSSVSDLVSSTGDLADSLSTFAGDMDAFAGDLSAGFGGDSTAGGDLGGGGDSGGGWDSGGGDVGGGGDSGGGGGDSGGGGGDSGGSSD